MSSVIGNCTLLHKDALRLFIGEECSVVELFSLPFPETKIRYGFDDRKSFGVKNKWIIYCSGVCLCHFSALLYIFRYFPLYCNKVDLMWNITKSASQSKFFIKNPWNHDKFLKYCAWAVLLSSFCWSLLNIEERSLLWYCNLWSTFAGEHVHNPGYTICLSILLN